MMDLKPCPFCGSEDIYETYSQEYALGTKNPEIFCNTCKAIFAIEDDSPYMNCDEDFKYRREKTAEAWNRRTVEERKTGTWRAFKIGECDLIECTACKVARPREEMPRRNGGKIAWKYCPECGARMEE